MSLNARDIIEADTAEMRMALFKRAFSPKNSQILYDLCKDEPAKTVLFLGGLIDEHKDLGLALVVRYLSLDNTVTILAGEGQAEQVMDLVFRGRHEQRLEMLTANEAISGLSKHGQADRVMEVLRAAADCEERKRLLRAPYAVSSLAKAGFSEELMSMIEALDDADMRAEILASPGLIDEMKKCQHGDRIMDLIRQATPEQKTHIFSSDFLLLNLILPDCQRFGPEVTLMINQLDENQRARIKRAAGAKNALFCIELDNALTRVRAFFDRVSAASIQAPDLTSPAHPAPVRDL